jgi:hypothetical protein
LSFLGAGLTVRRALKANIFVHILIYLLCFIGVHGTGVFLKSYYAGEARFVCHAAVVEMRRTAEDKSFHRTFTADDLPSGMPHDTNY